MKVDFTANLLDDSISIQLLQQLANQEQIARSPDRDIRRRAEREADKLRHSLLQRSDPTAIYLFLKSTDIANADAFRGIWQEQARSYSIEQQIPLNDRLNLLPSSPNLSLVSFPSGSFIIKFPFQLYWPYISRDDREFYIIDNPIQQEKVFRFPMVQPTSWKGATRAAMWQLGYRESDIITKRLFGIASDKDETGNSGCLRFFPSYFTETGLEIINPHDRETKTGKTPILIESVHRGATSTFSILYTPLEQQVGTEEKIRKEALGDLAITTKALHAMFTIYGFGAKTSSGFGVAANKLPGGQKGSFKIKLFAGAEGTIEHDFTSMGLLARKSAMFKKAYLKTLGGDE